MTRRKHTAPTHVRLGLRVPYARHNRNVAVVLDRGLHVFLLAACSLFHTRYLCFRPYGPSDGECQTGTRRNGDQCPFPIGAVPNKFSKIWARIVNTCF